MSTSADERLACAYCGLPVPASWWARSRSAPAEAVHYCCFGCRFAAKVTQDRGEQGEATWTLTRLGFAVFFTMNVMAFTMALWTQDVYGPESGRLSASLQGLFRYLCLLFALPVLMLLGGPLLDNAWQGLRRGVVTTDLFLVPGVAASYVYSAVSVLRDEGPVYFEVGCVVLVLVTLGRWLEASGKLKAGAAIEALHKLLPDTVRVIRPEGEVIQALSEVRTGDYLRVLAGERIPCDGRILGGTAAVDEQVFTGESSPVPKRSGDLVSSGTLDLDGELLIEASAPAGGGALARLIELIKAARAARGRFERLADRVAAVFLPTMVVLALAAFTSHASAHGLERGLLAALAVLVIACPCALGLATPLAIWTALGKAAQAQVLFRSGAALEQLADIRAVLFDKTGTLTTGTPVVADFAVAEGGARDSVLFQAARVASASAHAHSVAVRQFAEQHLASLVASESGGPASVRTLPGLGLIAHGSSERHAVYLGSVQLMEKAALNLPASLGSVVQAALAEAQPLTCIGWDRLVRGVFVLREQLRPEAKTAVAELRQQVSWVGVLTGDHQARGLALGTELGIPVEAELRPEDKVTAVHRVQLTFGATALVGDGLNDAPALARSDLGIAMGCGADVARDAAPVCLLGNDLRRLPWAVALARRTVRVIRQNLFWAFAYNAVGLGLAFTGTLNPVAAAAAMLLSSAFVLANSARLGRTPVEVLS